MKPSPRPGQHVLSQCTPLAGKRGGSVDLIRRSLDMHWGHVNLMHSVHIARYAHATHEDRAVGRSNFRSTSSKFMSLQTLYMSCGKGTACMVHTMYKQW